MALIEIDGLPFLIAWWIFPWRTVSHNQMVAVKSCLNKQLSTGHRFNFFQGSSYLVTYDVPPQLPSCDKSVYVPSKPE